MRFIRIATLAENDPHAIDVGITSPGKILINNQGSNDILIGQDRSDVLAATASQYLTLSAGVMLVFDVSEMVASSDSGRCYGSTLPAGIQPSK